MLKKVVFLGLAATAVTAVCVAKHAAQRRDAIKVKSRNNDAASSKSQTVNQPGKVPVRHCPAYALIDAKALRSAYRHGRRG